ncbi:MAG: B12-binding domain-containing radical SAM protein [Blastocatellia bacterium]|nr:B12-binding domain-containing radical SAM protein [Blastocatellia bacterium]
MRKSILLISADHDPEFTNIIYHEIPRRLQKKAFMVPLNLATIAGLTPEQEYEVDIWDEPVHGLIDEQTEFKKEYDLVGITAFSSHMRRARKIAKIVRSRGIVAAIGGPGVTAAPESCRSDFDILFIGEAELTWPQFLEDFQRGSYSKEYRVGELPGLESSPTPRWDSIADVMKSSYVTGGIQVTRGCPFDCEFCGVWKTFGRKMRTKPIEQVIREVINLQKLGMESVLYCSDNFAGNRRYAKELMRAVTPVNNSFDKPISFATELDITIVHDDEMLELLADANFSSLLIGIETPNKDSLKEARKRQNLRGDLVDYCRKIQSYGVPIDGSMIVGFDHDTLEAFDLQFEFIQEAYIPIPKMHMLKAIAGTELRTRMIGEKRVLNMNVIYQNVAAEYLDANLYTNILPKNMSRIELFAGYLALVEKVFNWDNFEERIKGFISNIKRQPKLRVEDPNIGTVGNLRQVLYKLPEQIQGNISRILDYTEQRASFMMRVVATLVFRQFFEWCRLPVIRQEIMSQIRVEETLDESAILAASALSD